MSKKLDNLQSIQRQSNIGVHTPISPSLSLEEERRKREQLQDNEFVSGSNKLNKLREIQNQTKHEEYVGKLYNAPDTMMDMNRINDSMAKYQQYVADNDRRLKELEDIKSGNVEPESVTEARKNIANLNETQQKTKKFLDSIGKEALPNKVGEFLNSSVGEWAYDTSKNWNPLNLKTPQKPIDILDYMKDRAKVNTYDEAVKNGKGYEYFTDDEKTEYADRKIRQLSDEEQRVLGEYADEYSKQMDNMFGLINPKMKANDSTVMDGIFDNHKLKLNIYNNNRIATIYRQLKHLGWDDEKFEEYTDYAKRVRNSKDTQKITSNYEILPNDPNTAGKVVRNIANDLTYNPVRGLSSIITNSQKDNLGYDTNSAYNRMTSVSNQDKNQITENVIGDEHPVGQFLFGAGMSAAESAETMAIGGMVGKTFGASLEGAEASQKAINFATKFFENASLIPFATDSYTNAYIEGKQRGLTDSEAEKVAIASGVIEAGTEKISLDHFYGMLKDDGVKLTKNLIIDWLAQAGIEGSEEALGDIANRIYQAVAIDNGKSEFASKVQAYENAGYSHEEAVKISNEDFWKEVGQDALAGAISGGLIGGVGASVNIAKGNAQVNNIKNTFNETSQMDANSEYDGQIKAKSSDYAKNPARYLADTIDDSSEVGKKQKAEAEKIADKIDNGKKLTPNDIFALNTMREIAEENRNANAEAKYQEYLKEMSNVPLEYRTAPVPTSYKEGFNKMQESAKNGDLKGISDAYQSLKNSSSAEARENSDTALELVATQYGLDKNTVEGLKVTPQDAYVKGLKGESKGIMSHEAAEAYDMGAQRKAHMNTSVDTKNLEGFSVEDGKIVKNGKAVDLNSFDDYSVNKALKGALAQDTELSQKAYLEYMEDGVNIDTYDNEFRRLYRAGLTGASEKVVSLSSLDNASDIYNLGVQDRENQLKYEASNRVVSKITKKGAGQFIDARTHKSANINTDFMRLMAEATGLKVVLTDRAEDNRQAEFVVNKSTIRVTEDHASQMIHELGEFIDAYAPEEYEGIRSAVAKAVSKVSSIDYDATLQAYHNAYKRINPKQTVLESSREMTNDALVSLLSREDGANALSQALTEEFGEEKAKTIGQKIVDFFKGIVNAIKDMINSSDINSYQRKILNAKVDNMEEIVGKFMTGLNIATQNYQNSDDIFTDSEGNADSLNQFRYSLDVVEPVKPSSDMWKSGATFDEVIKKHPNLYDTEGMTENTGNKTQITSTVKTYEKIYDILKSEGFDGTILDASSGKGLGTFSGRENYGFDVDDIEPYPSDDYTPMFTDYSKLNKKYDVIISNAVLNVLPQDQRDALVLKMGSLLNEGGRMFINVRGKDVLNSSGKIAINKDTMEYFIPGSRSYQKGFTINELKAYLEDALGEDYIVEKTNVSNKFGGVSVIVFKGADIRHSVGVDYDAKQRYVDNLNNENAKVNTLSEDEHDALSTVARLRHEIHSNWDNMWNAESSSFDELWGYLPNSENDGLINETLEEAGLDTIDFPDFTSTPNSYDFDYQDEYESMDEWKENSGDYEQFVNDLSKANELIEKYLQKIDKEHGTNYSPTGYSRLRNSLSVDSEGRELTPKQVEFFKNSKVRDDNGKLLVVYHGTNETFNEFKANEFAKESSGLSQIKGYFSENEEYASRYGDVTPYYLNISNPLDFGDKAFTIPQFVNFLKSKGIDGIKVDSGVAKDSTIGGNFADGSYYNPYELIDAISMYWSGDGNVTEKIKEAGYDGLTWDEEGIAWMPFENNSIKKVDNSNPTDNEDIRKSLNIDDISFDKDTTWSENASDILNAGITGTTHEVSKAKVDSIATKILKHTGSTMSHSKLSDMLWKTFTYMTDKKFTDSSDMMSIFEDIARPIIDKSNNLQDSGTYDMFVSNLDGFSFKLTDAQLRTVSREFGSYNEFRKAIAPINVTKGATSSLAEIWDDMSVSSLGLLDSSMSEENMPLALYDTLSSLRPTIRNDYNGDYNDVARDLAMSITEEFLREEQRQDLVTKMQNERAAYRKKVDAEFKRRLEEERQNMRWQIASDRFVNKTEIAKARAKNKQILENNRERNLAQNQKRIINKNAKALMDMMIAPTDKKHIPSELIEPTYELLTALDFVTPTIDSDENGFYTRIYDPSNKNFIKVYGKTTEELMQKVEDSIANGYGSRNQIKWQTKLKAIRDVYTKALTSVDNFKTEEMKQISEMLDAEIELALNNLIEDNEGKVNINTLSSQDLKVINSTLKNILHAINNYDKALASKQSIAELQDATLLAASKKSSKSKSWVFADKVQKTLEIDMMTPDTFFSMMGSHGEEMSSELIHGFEKKVKFIQDTSNYTENLYKKNNVTMNELDKWSRDTVEIRSEFDGRNVTFTIPQLMSLYELNKREDIKEHFRGGFRPSDIITRRMGVESKYSQNPIHLTQEDLLTLFANLSDKQKAVADGFQSWMAGYCGEKGNEVSMALYGYNKYNDEHYFPSRVDQSTVNSKTEENKISDMYGIKNPGFSKSLKKKANNPIIVDDIFEVYSNHITDMSSYYGFAPVITDFNRWFNGKHKVEDAETGFIIDNNVKDAINKNLYRTDDSGTKYYEKLVSDINRLEKSGEVNPFWNSLVGNYKGAAVSGNIRVVIQQPTAYTRALNMVDFKYLAKAMPKALTSPKEMKRIKDACPLAYWKSQGYYEASLGKSVSSIITGRTTLRENLIEKTMWLAGKADDITWSCLYNALEMEQRDLHPDIKGEEFTDLVNARFNKVVAETQVVDCTVMKSQWMRATGGIAKLQTAFMSEPIKSYNMVMKSMFKDIDKYGKNVLKWKSTRKALAVMLVTDALTSLAQSLVDALRYKTDDDDYIELLLEYLKDNMIDNANPLNRVPGLKDISDAILSAIKGESKYGSNVGQTIEGSSVNSIIDMISTTSKLVQNDYNKTGYAAYMTYAKGLSNISGVPLYNLSRDFASFWNAFADDNHDLVKTKPKANDKYKPIYKALDKNKADEDLYNAINKAMEEGGKIKDVSKGIQNTFKSDYIEAINNGNEEKADEINEKAVRGYMAIGLSRADAQAEVNSWTESSTGFEDLDKAIESGEGMTDIVDELINNGKKEKAMINHIMGAYGDTILYNRSKGIKTDLEANVDTILHMLGTSLAEEL